MAQNQNQNQGYQPIDESKVNWDKIEEKFGISKEVLEKTGAKCWRRREQRTTC